MLTKTSILTTACGFVLAAGAVAINARTFAATVMGSDKKLNAPILSMLHPVSLNKCSLECGFMSGCVAFNHNAADGICELLNRTKPASLSAGPGWSSHRTQLQSTPNTLNPCASNPCAAGKVCVRYMPPAQVPFNPEGALNYSLKGYACSAHQWLIDEKNQGKTDCFFVASPDRNFPGYDIYATYMYFYDAFDAIAIHNSLSLLCLFSSDAVERCWFKSSTPFIFPSNLKYEPLFIFWYPMCQ